MGRNNIFLRQQPMRLSSPIQGPHCSPLTGEGSRKGDLNIVCSSTPGWPTAATKASLPSSRKNHKTKPMTIILATWNVRTLLDAQDGTERPRRRTALIAHELKRYNIDIVALSEMRFSGEDSLTEVGEGHTFFWRGLPENERRLHGVGFAVKSRLLSNIPESPQGISERLMIWRIPLVKGRFATLISAYAPTLGADENIKDAFYESLDAALSKIPDSDKLVLMGDFNA